MLEAVADLWEYPADVRTITTNGFVKHFGECVMGRGVALQAKQRYPWLPGKLGRMIGQHGNRCFRFPTDDGFDILTFPVKPVRRGALPGWRCPAEIPIIVRSCEQAVEMADKFEWERIVLPRAGCGNGGLRWMEVRPVLRMYLDDRFTVVNFE